MVPMERHFPLVAGFLFYFAATALSFDPGEILSIKNKKISDRIIDSTTFQSLRGLVGSTNKCGCDSCTETVLTSLAEGYQCGDHINWIVANTGLSEIDAYLLVGGNEYPRICGACDPTKCPSSMDQPMDRRDNALSTFS
jgi:hypothetical protein